VILLSINRMILGCLAGMIVVAVACSGGFDESEVQRRVEATQLSETATVEARYEPQLAAFRVGSDSTFVHFEEQWHLDFAVLWRAKVDLGEVSDGRESYIAFVRQSTLGPDGTPWVEVTGTAGLGLFRRIHAESSNNSRLEHWSRPSTEDHEVALCTLVELALYPGLGSSIAAAGIARNCFRIIEEWKVDEITGQDSRTLLDRLKRLVDE
jgi:hypothetical protein